MKQISKAQMMRSGFHARRKLTCHNAWYLGISSSSYLVNKMFHCQGNIFHYWHLILITTSWAFKCCCLASKFQRRVYQWKPEWRSRWSRPWWMYMYCPRVQRDILQTQQAQWWRRIRLNTKCLSSVSRVPRLLKSVIGCGRVFLRPIQKDLDWVETLLLSQNLTLFPPPPPCCLCFSCNAKSSY